MRHAGILFVCFANICRSPMAEAVARQRLAGRGMAGRLRVASRGTTAIHAGKPADPRAVAALRAAGIDTGAHRARQIDDADFADYDCIVALDPSILRTLQGWAPPGYRGELGLLTRFGSRPHGAGIEDPFSAGPEAFTEALREIDRGVCALLDRALPSH